MADVRTTLAAEFEQIVSDARAALPLVQVANQSGIQSLLADIRVQLDKADADAAVINVPPPPTGPPVWTAFTPPPAKVGEAYSYHLHADGATSYHLTGGGAPPVMGFDQFTGELYAVAGNGQGSVLPMAATDPNSGQPATRIWTLNLLAINAAGMLAYKFGVTILVNP